MENRTDVLVVGSGVSGLFLALQLPEYLDVTIITKLEAEKSDSFLAQGGICVLRGEEDYELYFEDTMKAGHYKNNAKAVELMIRSSNYVIKELIRYGVRFQRDKEGRLEYTKEGAHSKDRILYHKDITGEEITKTLLREARNRKNIQIIEHMTLIDFIEKENICIGIVAVSKRGERTIFYSKNVVLASGGIGGLYQNSTNYSHLTGDALAIALKHNVEVENLDYVQIHPTTLFSTKEGRRFLISESVRGEGAVLLNKNGERFTDELMPRDVVSKAIFKQMEEDRSNYVLLDMKPIGEKKIREHFPNILKRCLEEGIDPLKEPIPVVPAQHYHMGGIKVDLFGKTSMKALYAIGEASCNGVHGKNRLASNSLLEAMVFAAKVSEDIAFGTQRNEIEVGDVDLTIYEDLEEIKQQYKTMIFKEIEKEKKENE